MLRTALFLAILKKTLVSNVKRRIRMWKEKVDTMNEIFDCCGLKFYIDTDNFRLYHDEELISDGFIYVNSVSLQYYEFFKTADFNCTCFQVVGSKVEKKFRVQWEDEIDENFGAYDADFSTKEKSEEDKIAEKLQKNPGIEIYNKKRFNKAARSVLQAYVYIKCEEMRSHVGWMTCLDYDGKTYYEFRGITDEATILSKGKPFRRVYLLSDAEKTLAPRLDRTMQILNQMNEEVSYPVFLAVLYMLTDKDLLESKPKIYLNISGRFRRDGTLHFLSPHGLANMLCNFENNLANQRNLNVIQKAYSNISMQESTGMVSHKISVFRDMPMIVHSKKTTISKNCRDYQRMIKLSGDLAEEVLTEKGKPIYFAHSFPVFLTEQPMEDAGIFNIHIKNNVVAEDFDEKKAIMEIRSFYRHFIEQLMDYRDKMIAEPNLGKWLQKAIKKYCRELTSDDLYDENNAHIVVAYATALAVLETILFEKSYEGLWEDFQIFRDKVMASVKPLLLFPWIEEPPKIDVVSTFLQYVAAIIKSEEQPFKIFDSGELIYLQFPECVTAFEKQYGISQTKDAIGRHLKKNGWIKTNKSGGYFVSRQVHKVKYKVLAVYRKVLEDCTADLQ